MHLFQSRGGVLEGQAAPTARGDPCYFGALALDPGDRLAATNLTAVFVNWGPQLLAERKFEDAIRVLEFGLTIAPTSSPLKNNYSVAWTRSILDRIEAGDDQEAVKIVSRAGKAMPGASDFQPVAPWFFQVGQNQAKGDREAELKVIDRALKVVPEPEHPKVLEWRSNLFRQWSQAELDAKASTSL